MPHFVHSQPTEKTYRFLSADEFSRRVGEFVHLCCAGDSVRFFSTDSDMAQENKKTDIEADFLQLARTALSGRTQDVQVATVPLLDGRESVEHENPRERQSRLLTSRDDGLPVSRPLLR